MIAATDYVGIGALVSAIAAAVVSIIVAIRQPIIGAKIQNIQEQVATSNGHTLGEVAEKIDQRNTDKDARG